MSFESIDFMAGMLIGWGIAMYHWRASVRRMHRP